MKRNLCLALILLLVPDSVHAKKKDKKEKDVPVEAVPAEPPAEGSTAGISGSTAPGSPQIPIEEQAASIDARDHDALLESLARGKNKEALSAIRQGAHLFAEESSAFLPLLSAVFAIRDEDYRAALDFLSQARKTTPLLSDYIDYFEAKSWLALNKPDKALGLLKAPATAVRQIDKDTQWLRVKTLALAGRTDEATRILDGMRKGKLGEAEAIRVAYHTGWLALKKGNRDRAVSVWAELLSGYAGSAFEAKIAQEIGLPREDLSSLLTDAQKKTRATVLLKGGLSDEALSLFESLRAKGLDIREDLAKAHFGAKRYDEAARLFEELLAARGNDLDLLNDLASSYGRSDQFPKALAVHDRILKNFPTSHSAVVSRYKKAFIYFDSGDYEKAHDAFSDLIAKKVKYKSEDMADYLLWSTILTKRHGEAVNLLTARLKGLKDKDARARLIYWKARELEELNRKGEAQSTYREIIQTAPKSYYAFLSQQRLSSGGLVPVTLVNPNHLHFIPKKGYTPPAVDEKALPANHPLRRAILLSKAGLSAYAYDEALLGADAPAAGVDGDALSLLLMKGQCYSRVMSKGSSALKASPSLDRLNFTWKQCHPKSYENWMNVYANQVGLERYIAWAIMREESAFKPGVLSSADAIGLMQVIPRTGMEIARDLRKENFHPEDLTDPMTAIEFGTWYLKKNHDRFGGNLVYTIASYNAGPEAVTRWKKWGDKIPTDLFIELIPYDETNNYVKKVLRSYWVYKRLYE